MTTVWETKLPLTLKRQDFAQVFLFEKLLLNLVGPLSECLYHTFWAYL
jgi:hypothetical protein